MVIVAPNGGDEQSLEQIENASWGEPPPDATRLVATVHRLRKVPLAQLGPEDLRVLLAQGVGTEVLVPRTLDLLEREPLLEADFYPGDVLAAVLRVPASYWLAHPTQLKRVETVLAALQHADAELEADVSAFRSRIRNLTTRSAGA